MNNSVKTMKGSGVAWLPGGTGDREEEKEGGKMEGKTLKGCSGCREEKSELLLHRRRRASLASQARLG